MSEIGLTSLVLNSKSAKQLGLKPFYYRYRSCNPNFPNRTQTSVGGFNPSDQYQKQKIMQKSVRVQSSLYTANLGSLSSYKSPNIDPNAGVNWNQMSDRPDASVQRATVPTRANTKHTSITSSKPGCQTPGGQGCDVKHNSYERYLNRLKGKGHLRRGTITTEFGNPITFNRALPVYGGKTVKTNIVSRYNCPINGSCLEQDKQIYDNPDWQPYPVSRYGFKVGDYVYAKKTGETYYNKAEVVSVVGTEYTIRFEDETEQSTNNVHELFVYFPCECFIPTKEPTIDVGDCKLTDYNINLLYLLNNY